MNDEYTTDDLIVREQLRDLRAVRAPQTLLPQVMARVAPADRYFPLESPVGRVYVAYSDRGLSAVMLAEDESRFVQAFRLTRGRSAAPAEEPPAKLVASLIETLEGRGAPDLRFDLDDLSQFERAVLLKALEIPRGEIRPYAWIAREIGRPHAMRAVGNALARNPIPLFIPCHRVVRSDGHIGNYGLGGPTNKRRLLQYEGALPA